MLHMSEQSAYRKMVDNMQKAQLHLNFRWTANNFQYVLLLQETFTWDNEYFFKYNKYYSKFANPDPWVKELILITLTCVFCDIFSRDLNLPEKPIIGLE
jgi:hypothetical protein